MKKQLLSSTQIEEIFGRGCLHSIALAEYLGIKEADEPEVLLNDAGETLFTGVDMAKVMPVHFARIANDLCGKGVSYAC